MIKILHIARDTRKTLKRGKKWKTKTKFNNVTTTIKFFTFIFVHGKGYILLENIIWENSVVEIQFLSELIIVLNL